MDIGPEGQHGPTNFQFRHGPGRHPFSLHPASESVAESGSKWECPKMHQNDENDEENDDSLRILRYQDKPTMGLMQDRMCDKRGEFPTRCEPPPAIFVR
jgi:hypothetical protein